MGNKVSEFPESHSPDTKNPKKEATMWKNILVATEQPDTCDEKVLLSAQISSRYGAELHLLHILESDSTIYRNYVKHFKTREEIVCDQEYVTSVQTEIIKNCDSTLEPIGNYKIKVVPGFPWVEILRYSRKNHIDLIVVGPHGQTFDENAYSAVRKSIGNTVKKVLKRSHAPLMFVNHPLPAKVVKFKRILIGIDFSPSCTYALRFSAQMAEMLESELFVFHMMPDPSLVGHPQTKYEELLEHARLRLESFCKEFLKNISHKYIVSQNTKPHMEILKRSQEYEVDLIAMGSHTKGDGGKWYVGSAVEDVSKKSVCPVLVVTDPKALVDWSD
jgi:nucleotide-binding universal stress UspA family protein